MDWTATISGTGFSKNTDGTTITAGPSISSSARTGEVSYTQATSGKTGKVSLTQAAYVQPKVTLTISNLTNQQTYYLFKGNSIPSSSGIISYLGFSGMLGSFTAQWNPQSPLKVNDPSSTTGLQVSATSGDLVVVRIRSGSSWVSVGSITLENKDQTIRVSQ